MNANSLLTWLSAKGCGSWTRYKAAVDEQQVSEESDVDGEDIDVMTPDRMGYPIYHRVRQNLERLGHAEFFRSDFPSGWRVVPPTLTSVTNASQQVIGILCGARTDRLMTQISAFSSDLLIERTDQAECPDRIQVIGSGRSQFQQLADASGIFFQPDAPRVLLAAIPPVDDRQFRRSAELPFGSDWDVSRFTTDTLGWTAATAANARMSSFGLFRFNIPFQPQYYLKLRGEAYRLPVQVGKYIVMRKARRRVLLYDPVSEILRMPVSCRPPRLFDRALTLCSGLVPDLERGFLTYQNINREIALTAFGLLRQ